MSACDALQEMKNEIAKYSRASEGDSGDSLEIRYARLERRLRSVEQPGACISCSLFVIIIIII
jgi:uncharacterized protein YukE